MDSPTPDQRLAGNCRAEAARQDLRQAAIAQALGLTARQTSRRMSGEVALSAIELQKLANLLHVPVSALLGDAAVSA